MPISSGEILRRIHESFPDAEVELRDTVGDENHYEMSIRATRLMGLSRVEQHRLVMEALGEIVGTSLHAISIKVIQI